MSKNWGFNPFEERVLPPMSADLFTTLVVARLRSAPRVEIDRQRRLELELRVNGERRVVQLHDYYEKYRFEPERVDRIVTQAVESISAGTDELESLTSFEQVASRLFPLLVSSSDWQSKRDLGVRLVVRPLVQDLGVSLVLDEADSIAYVELDAIPRWGIDVALAYERALQNLESTAHQLAYTRFGKGADTLLIDRATDGYAATRAILPSRLEDWSRQVQGHLVLGMPYRDLLVGFGSEHPNLNELRLQIEKDARAHEHALSEHLLTFRAGAIELWQGTVPGHGEIRGKG